MLGKADVVSLALAELSASESQRLTELEGTIQSGLQSFVEVGTALCEIRDGRLYRDSHGTFEDYCRERWSMSRFYAHRLIDASVVADNLLPTGNIPASERHVRPLTALDPAQQAEVWNRAVATAPNGKMTAAHVEKTVRELTGEPERLKTCDKCGNVWMADLPYCPYCNLSPEARAHGLNMAEKAERLAVHFTSDTPEWYTPPEIIERTKTLFGRIDLDPCSNSSDKPNVPARKHFTQEDDGLAQKWAGKVYMNPPYGREIDDWIEKLTVEHTAGNVTEAIALVPSRTDTAWFRKLRNYPRCFVSGRLNFSGHENAAPFPSVVVYIGDNLKAFKAAFSDIGDVYILSK